MITMKNKPTESSKLAQARRDKIFRTLQSAYHHCRTATSVSTMASIALLLLSYAPLSSAGEADVLAVEITALGEGQYRISATVRHEDSGWDHYANRWDVLNEKGDVLGSRELAHPHENEQPFTRSLTLSIPNDVTTITVRAHDSVHELGGAEFSVAVPKP